MFTTPHIYVFYSTCANKKVNLDDLSHSREKDVIVVVAVTVVPEFIVNSKQQDCISYHCRNLFFCEI